MNGWDAINNTVKPLDIKHALVCTKCGTLRSCVSDEGFDDHREFRALVCNHCYSEMIGTNECNQQISDGHDACAGCEHLHEHRNQMDCDDYSTCKLCPSCDSCEDSGSK